MLSPGRLRDARVNIPAAAAYVLAMIQPGNLCETKAGHLVLVIAVDFATGQYLALGDNLTWREIRGVARIVA